MTPTELIEKVQGGWNPPLSLFVPQAMFALEANQSMAIENEAKPKNLTQCAMQCKKDFVAMCKNYKTANG